MGKVARCATLKENERYTRVVLVPACPWTHLRTPDDNRQKEKGHRGGGTGVSLPLPRCDYELGKRVSEIAESDATRSCTYKLTWLCT